MMGANFHPSCDATSRLTGAGGGGHTGGGRYVARFANVQPSFPRATVFPSQSMEVSYVRSLNIAAASLPCVRPASASSAAAASSSSVRQRGASRARPPIARATTQRELLRNGWSGWRQARPGGVPLRCGRPGVRYCRQLAFLGVTTQPRHTHSSGVQTRVRVGSVCGAMCKPWRQCVWHLLHVCIQAGCLRPPHEATELGTMNLVCVKE